MTTPATNFGPDFARNKNQQKIYDKYGGVEKYAAAEKERTTAIAKANKQIAILEKENKGLKEHWIRELEHRRKQAVSDGLPNVVAAIDVQLKEAYKRVEFNENKIKNLKKQISKANQKFREVPSKLAAEQQQQLESGKPFDGTWKFNAPLVSEESFKKMGSLPTMISAGNGSVDDALKFWGGKSLAPLPYVVTDSANTARLQAEAVAAAKPLRGKGSIQMDRLTNTSELRASARKAASANNLPFDETMYGFRFQYNPTIVTMSWAGVMGANPVFEATGNDPAVPLTQNLIPGQISFEIILNRIGDIAALNPDGSLKNGFNPYPWNIDPSDRKDIAEKGTMYDIEYLLRTLHGYAFYTKFQTTLMGRTNDPGWLPVRPIELHLGNKMRYRASVKGLNVEHKIFSEKMIPILSVVSITCGRYWDGLPNKESKK